MSINIQTTNGLKKLSGENITKERISTALGYTPANENVVNEHVNDTDIHITTSERNQWDSKSDFSGDYNDLQNKPSIMESNTDKINVVDDLGNIILKVDSEGVQTTELTLGAEDAAIRVGEKLNALDEVAALVPEHIKNTTVHVTETERIDWNNKSNFSGNYEDLQGKPSIMETNADEMTVVDDSGNIILKVNSNGVQTTELILGSKDETINVKEKLDQAGMLNSDNTWSGTNTFSELTLDGTNSDGHEVTVTIITNETQEASNLTLTLPNETGTLATLDDISDSVSNYGALDGANTWNNSNIFSNNAMFNGGVTFNTLLPPVSQYGFKAGASQEATGTTIYRHGNILLEGTDTLTLPAETGTLATQEWVSENASGGAELLSNANNWTGIQQFKGGIRIGSNGDATDDNLMPNDDVVIDSYGRMYIGDTTKYIALDKYGFNANGNESAYTGYQDRKIVIADVTSFHTLALPDEDGTLATQEWVTANAGGGSVDLSGYGALASANTWSATQQFNKDVTVYGAQLKVQNDSKMGVSYLDCDYLQIAVPKNANNTIYNANIKLVGDTSTNTQQTLTLPNATGTLATQEWVAANVSGSGGSLLTSDNTWTGTNKFASIGSTSTDFIIGTDYTTLKLALTEITASTGIRVNSDTAALSIGQIGTQTSYGHGKIQYSKNYTTKTLTLPYVTGTLATTDDVSSATAGLVSSTGSNTFTTTNKFAAGVMALPNLATQSYGTTYKHGQIAYQTDLNTTYTLTLPSKSGTLATLDDIGSGSAILYRHRSELTATISNVTYVLYLDFYNNISSQYTSAVDAIDAYAPSPGRTRFTTTIAGYKLSEGQYFPIINTYTSNGPRYLEILENTSLTTFNFTNNASSFSIVDVVYAITL